MLLVVSIVMVLICCVVKRGYPRVNTYPLKEMVPVPILRVCRERLPLPLLTVYHEETITHKKDRMHKQQLSRQSLK